VELPCRDMTVDEVAAYLHVSASGVRRMMGEGHFPHLWRIKLHIRIPWCCVWAVGDPELEKTHLRRLWSPDR
jgi:excisionase family DNA binding protein